MLSCSSAQLLLNLGFKVTHAPCLPADLVGGLEATVVGDVLPQGVSSVQRLLVDAVVAVLLHHALGLLLERLHRGVLPPGTQVPVLVVLPPFEQQHVMMQLFRWTSLILSAVGKIKPFTNLGHQKRESVHGP